MAEYYPLLAKAVGSLPNSTPETRRVVYERARKALIGQLRTLHPPIPDADIERESVALDRAIERLETELARNVAASSSPAKPAAPPTAPAAPSAPGAGSAAKATSPVNRSPAAPPAEARALRPPRSLSSPEAPPIAGAAPADASATATEAKGERRPLFPLRAATPPTAPPLDEATDARPGPPRLKLPADLAVSGGEAAGHEGGAEADDKRVKLVRDPQRPFAPQPSSDKSALRRLWVIFVAVGAVVAVVAFAAWKLRDNPDTIAKTKAPAQTTQADAGKIAERVGGPSTGAAPAAKSPASDTARPDSSASTAGGATAPVSPAAPATTNDATSAPNQPSAVTPAPSNPAVAVAHRAALLVEAPDEPNKVKTFIGTVVWKLNNVPQGPNDAVGLAVEADVEIPEDKLKAVVTFAKNTEASLTASHTINVRFTVEGGSFSGDVKQISVPQMRAESSATGEPLAGVTVPIVQNSFLVGLSPGNAEAANTDLMRRMQWVDIPMLLDSGKIAKLTFEKGDSGARDINEALEAWAKAN